MTRHTDTPSPTSHWYASWLTKRQSLYHACCQRTAAHRHDCMESDKREQPVRRKP